MRKYCCDTFKELYSEEENGIRGISIIRKENKVFFLRYGTVDDENFDSLIELLKETVGKASFHLSLTEEIAISFCPWCGAKLAHNY